jgi:hypothetical protein
MVRPGSVDQQLPDFLSVRCVDNLRMNDFFGRFKRAREYSKIMGEIIDSLGPGDILYYRCPNPVLFFYPLNYFKRFRKCILVTEHQTLESVEYSLNKNRVAVFFDKIFGNILRRQSDIIVGVTDEITRYEVARAGDPGKSHITIGNGIDVTSVPIRTPVSFDGAELHILCVANVSPWHGLDRLLNGIALYNGTTKIVFHIAGDGGALPHLRKLIKDQKIPGTVIFHGFQSGENLNRLFNSCHLAIGSLGIHRIGLKDASILKAREYCARGIPYVIAFNDPDFPDNYPYILKIPADETPVDITKIVKFAREVSNTPGHPQAMHLYAQEHLDWSVKMKLLKGFLERHFTNTDLKS